MKPMFFRIRGPAEAMPICVTRTGASQPSQGLRGGV